MKTPEGLLGANGKPGKIEIILKGGEKALQEFSKDETLADGNTVKCYILTAPGDIISVDITAGAHTADVFDLEVDGILRASLASKGLAKSFHGIINKVCFKAKSGKKGGDGAKYYATFGGNGTQSAVSSLVVNAWRKNPAPDTANKATAIQYFSWEEHASWKEVKHYIKEGPNPPFEIDFIDLTKLSKKQKEKMDEIPKRDYSQYSLITTFIFELQSTSNLATLGFEHVPIYVPTPLPVKPPRAKKELKGKKSQVEVEDEDEDDGASIIGGLEESKKDISKSLSFSRAQLFSGEPVSSPGNSSSENIEERALASTSNTAVASSNVDTTSPPLIPMDSLVEPIIKENETRQVEPTIGNHSPPTQKGLVLHGEVGGPARRAFLARGDPQEIASQSQPESESPVDLNETITETTNMATRNDFTAVNKKAGSVADRMMRSISPVHESPAFEPLTPPISAKKPLPGRDDLKFAHRLIGSPTQSFSLSQSIELNQSSMFSQATTTSIQVAPTQLGPAAESSEPAVDLDKVVEDLEEISRKTKFTTKRAASPALSDATEVADPMEVMESVRNSQRSSVGSGDFQREIADYYQNSWQHKSPTPDGFLNFPRAEKRKTYTSKVGEQLEVEQPRKVRKIETIEQKMMAAKAKLAAATERNRQLERERQAAMDVKKQNDEVEALFRKAEQMEQANDALEVSNLHFQSFGYLSNCLGKIQAEVQALRGDHEI
ncbi:hypothetical protein N431DRAFT_352353 [Stipitochalara longipes BDJ]|nr:hypothetical protein N431DRAFT_352353 [Stipitochalara longipes BDJ]